MSPFSIQLIRGFLPQDIQEQDKTTLKELQNIGAIEECEDGLYRLKSLYRVGRLYISKDGKGYLEAQNENERDLLIEPSNLNGAKSLDEVVVKRVIARRGRASGKVVSIVRLNEPYIIGYLDKNSNQVLHIKTDLPIEAKLEGVPSTAFKDKTVFVIEPKEHKIIQILGTLYDPMIDEKLSLMLYNRPDDNFDKECIDEAKAIDSEVKAKDIESRVDLRELDFCTIDPVTAKDFDDAIYFDLNRYELYVAIADVSYYVSLFSHIDKEAKVRGFTTYLPHKAFPMLPRELSENICSLKPHVDRLAFICKLTLDKNTLKPIKEEFFEGVIHSKRRFNYDEVDAIIEGKRGAINDDEQRILKWLLPLQKITQRLKKDRLKSGFDFRSQEIKITIDANALLKDTQIETGTPSHSLIEECMLLANKASAKRFSGEGDSIFRIHEAPKEEKIEELLADLATIGIFVEVEDNLATGDIIRAIQKEATKMGLEDEVDELVIKSLQRASYRSYNVGHFGLGFKYYSHFTSPIRRYSDLILHRLIKSQINGDKKMSEYMLRNIEPLAMRVSELEREATKAEWDFRDRKFARWAMDNIDKIFKAKIVELDKDTAVAKAKLLCDIDGVIVNIKESNSNLFDEVAIKITDIDLAKAIIIGSIVKNIKE